MLSRKVNGELLVTWALPVAFVIHVRKMLSSNSSYMKKLPNNLLERDAQKARGRFKVRVHQEFIINQLGLHMELSGICSRLFVALVRKKLFFSSRRLNYKKRS